jgi:PAS domain S-box-containing protein
MSSSPDIASELRRELEETRARLAEAEEALNAIRNGEVDGLLVAGPEGEQIFTLNGSQEPYRLLIEQMTEGALTLSPEGVILYANQTFAGLLQMPLEQVIGAEFPGFVNPADQSVIASLIATAWTGNSRGMVSVRTAAGAFVPLRLGLSRLSLPQETLLCVVATDLTEQQRKDEVLRRFHADLEQRVAERTADLARSRLAALNLMEEAVEARKTAELTNRELTQEIAQRKRAEEAEREMGGRFSMALEVGNAGVWEWDLGSDEVRFDDRFHGLLGYAPGELPRTIRDWMPHHHPDDVPVWIPKAQAYLRGDSPIFESEHRIRDKAGTWNWVFTRGKVVGRTPTGAPERFLGIAINVTARKRAEEALRASEERHRMVTDTMLHGLVHQLRDGTIVGVNPAAERILGRTSAEFLGSSSVQEEHNTVHEDGSPFPGMEHPAMVALRTGQPVRSVVMGVWNPQRNQYRWIEIDAVPVFAPGQASPTEVYTVFADITERKRAEESLRASETEFRAMFEVASIGMAQADVSTGQWVRVNRKMCEITGYSQAEMLQKRVSEITYPEDRAKDWELFRQVVRGEVPDYRVEKRYIRKNDSVAWVNVNMTVIRDAAGAPVRTMATIEDITARKELENQYRQAQKLEAFGQLAGGVAHDFNNLLAVILMQAAEGECHPGLAQSIRDAFLEIKHAAERAASLTRQLLLFSRRQVIQPQTVDLNVVVENLGKMLRRIVGEDIRFRLDLHATPLWLHADPGMLDQVLLNLVVNARDAMPTGGNLTLTTDEISSTEEQARTFPDATAGRHARLTVTDTGCGIPPEILPRIFEPFFTTKGVGKGTGLGLATVFGIVKQHRGWIAVQSTPGQGTTFRIFLPFSEDHFPKTVAVANLRPPGGTETILLVEDDPGLRNTAQLILKRNGYHVVEAESGPSALTVSRQHPGRIDLLLTDMVMPEGMDGRDLATQLLAERPGLKVLYMSGYSTRLAGRELTLQPGQGFLQKPYTLEQLLAAVRGCLES